MQDVALLDADICIADPCVPTKCAPWPRPVPAPQPRRRSRPGERERADTRTNFQHLLPGRQIRGSYHGVQRIAVDEKVLAQLLSRMNMICRAGSTAFPGQDFASLWDYVEDIVSGRAGSLGYSRSSVYLASRFVAPNAASSLRTALPRWLSESFCRRCELRNGPGKSRKYQKHGIIAKAGSAPVPVPSATSTVHILLSP